MPLFSASSFPVTVGLIGHGAIGSVVAEAILDSTHGLRADRVLLKAVLVRRPRNEGDSLEKNTAKPKVLITNKAEDFFASGPFDVVIEASGQQTVRDHFARMLVEGTSVICTSIGALTDDKLRVELEQAAIKGNSQLLLASGAMPALDWMHSSAIDFAASQSVTAIQKKPPESW